MEITAKQAIATSITIFAVSFAGILSALMLNDGPNGGFIKIYGTLVVSLLAVVAVFLVILTIRDPKKDSGK